MTRIGRRRLLTTGVAAGVLAATGAQLAAGPRRGGTLTVAISGGNARDTFDSRTFDGLFMQAAAAGAVFETLTEVAADGTLRGELASGWETRDNNRVWVFDLLEGVRFHDGSEFGASDVVASIELHRIGSSPMAALVSQIDTITAETPTRVRFELTGGNVDFPYLLADPHLVIYPHANLEAAFRFGFGTGPYKVRSFEPGQTLQLDRVSDHRLDGAGAWFRRVTLLAIDDPAAQFAAFEARNIDAFDLIQPGALGRDLRCLESVGNGYVSVVPKGMGHDAAWHLGQALKLGIDRTELLAALGDRAVHLGHDTPIGPETAHFDMAMPVFDPDLARVHLRAADLEGQLLSLSFDPAKLAGAGAVVPVLVRLAERFGLHLDTTSEGVGLALQMEPGRPTADWALLTSPRGQVPNLGGDRVTALAQLARAESDSIARTSVYAEVQRLIRTEGTAYVPFFASHQAGVSSTIGIPDAIGSMLPLDDARFAKRWWRL